MTTISETPSPETVFDGQFLRATLWGASPQARGLYVTFRHRMPDPGQFTDAGPVKTALVRGMAQLQLQTRLNDWYLNPETPDLEAALRTLRPRFAFVRALGYSMGGYAALRYAAALALDQAVVVSPQFTLDRSILPEEQRYPEAVGFDPVLGDLRRHGHPGLCGIILFDPRRKIDVSHARLVASVMPGMRFAPCAFGGHPATTALRDAGGFRQFQALSLQDRPGAADFVQLHRKLRARSERYWVNRASVCLKRGKVTQAEIALGKADQLGG